MSGLTIEAMADAVEHAAVVVLLASRRYRESENCRSEACYAYQKRRPIIPVMAQESYTPEGWHGFIMGTRLYVDFSTARPRALGGALVAADGLALARAPPVFASDSDAASFASCMRGLLRELADRGRSALGSKGGSGCSPEGGEDAAPATVATSVFTDNDDCASPTAKTSTPRLREGLAARADNDVVAAAIPALRVPPVHGNPALTSSELRGAVGLGCSGHSCDSPQPYALGGSSRQQFVAQSPQGRGGASAESRVGIEQWALAASGSPEAASLMCAAGIDGAALAELARVCATDEGLALRLLREDVGIVALGPRLRIAAALRRLPLSGGDR